MNQIISSERNGSSRPSTPNLPPEAHRLLAMLEAQATADRTRSAADYNAEQQLRDQAAEAKAALARYQHNGGKAEYEIAKLNDEAAQAVAALTAYQGGKRSQAQIHQHAEIAKACREYVRRLKRPVQIIAVKQPKDLDEALTQLIALEAVRAQVEEAPGTVNEAERILDELRQLAEQGKPQIFLTPKTIKLYASNRTVSRPAPALELPFERLAHNPAIANKVAWLWSNWSAIEAELRAQIDTLYAGMQTISEPERLEKLRQLDAEILPLQRRIAAYVWTSGAFNWPAGINLHPAAVLQIST